MNLAIPSRTFGGYIFDCDGTLADTMPLQELFYQLGGKPTAQILTLLRDEHGLNVGDVPEAAERKEQYFLDQIGQVKPIEAVVEFARRWHGIKPMAVASGGYRRQIEQTLDALGIL